MQNALRMLTHTQRTGNVRLGGRPTLFHSTEWGQEILADNQIMGNSTIDPYKRPSKASDLRFDDQHHIVRGICVTRSFTFAAQFSNAIFALDRNAIQQRHRIFLRAEEGAYDLANDHGDFRIESEEFIVCSSLALSPFLIGIWVNVEYAEDADYQSLVRHDQFKGLYRQP